MAPLYTTSTYYIIIVSHVQLNVQSTKNCIVSESSTTNVFTQIKITYCCVIDNKIAFYVNLEVLQLVVVILKEKAPVKCTSY